MSRAGVAAAVIVVVAAAGAGVWYWRGGGAEQQAAGYVTESVDRGEVAVTVSATGTVNPVTTVQVGTYVSGPIRAIDVDFNSPVRRGQRVAKIDPAPFEVKVRRAEAGLATARARVEKDRADLDLKQINLRRQEELRSRKLNAQTEVDSARSDYEQAKAQLALDQAAVTLSEAEREDARINLAYTDITSPVDGVVVSRNVDVGQTVAASFQTPTLFLIAEDLAKMQVNTSVSESDIGAVRAGQSVSFTVDAYPGRPFPGTVLQVRNAPTTVQNVVTYDVVVSVDNRSLELKPGMTATVTITTQRRDDVLRIPVRALRFDPERKPNAESTPAAKPRSRDGGSTVVWAVKPDGGLRRVELTLGVRDEQHAEVVSGEVAAGDRLAVAFQNAARRAAAAPPPSLPGMRRYR